MKITAQQYAKTLFESTDGKTETEVSDIVKRFAEILKKDGQLKNVKKIMEKFSDLYNSEHRIVEAEIVSWEALSNELSNKLQKFLKEKYDVKEVIIKNTVDEKIIGGIIVRVGDEIMDGSILNQLKMLKNNLSK
jgi:F-type H+-transporting ATPase subunit delta